VPGGGLSPPIIPPVQSAVLASNRCLEAAFVDLHQRIVAVNAFDWGDGEHGARCGNHSSV
jgi:hypothetical protein